MGKVLALAIIIPALLAGFAMYYLQVYGFYEEVAPNGNTDVVLMPIGGDRPEPILYSNFRAIDSESSPIRYRACFETSHSIAMLSETFQIYDGAEPRVAPDWFDCFDAEKIGYEITAGGAVVFLATANLEYGIDRVVAVLPDGRGYIWHEINECGEKQYDGSPVSDDCPERDN